MAYNQKNIEEDIERIRKFAENNSKNNTIEYKEEEESKEEELFKSIIESEEFQKIKKKTKNDTFILTDLQLKLFKSKSISMLFNHIAFYTLSDKCEKKSNFFLKKYKHKNGERVRCIHIKKENLAKKLHLTRMSLDKYLNKLQRTNLIIVERDRGGFNIAINYFNYFTIVFCYETYIQKGEDIFPENFKNEFGLPRLS